MFVASGEPRRATMRSLIGAEAERITPGRLPKELRGKPNAEAVRPGLVGGCAT